MITFHLPNGEAGDPDGLCELSELVRRAVWIVLLREARQLQGGIRERALNAYAQARELAAMAPRLSLDPAATVFQMGGILAGIAGPASLKR